MLKCKIMLRCWVRDLEITYLHTCTCVMGVGQQPNSSLRDTWWKQLKVWYGVDQLRNAFQPNQMCRSLWGAWTWTTLPTRQEQSHSNSRNANCPHFAFQARQAIMLAQHMQQQPMHATHTLTRNTTAPYRRTASLASRHPTKTHASIPNTLQNWSILRY